MKKLAANYAADIDSVDRYSWYEIISKFDDANIYQTWSYDKIRFGEKNTSHLILKSNGNVVGAAQVRILKIPIMNVGIAYVFWGPLWKLHNGTKNIEIFRQVIRALRNEYACRRGLVLRVYPVIFSDESDKFLSLLEQEGFTLRDKNKRDRTLLIDLSPPLAVLRKGLDQKWRNCLNRAEKNELGIVEGHDDELFEMFIRIYGEMLERKRFIESNDTNEFRLIQKDLPEKYKMKILLCRFKGEMCAGAIFSAIGNTGVYLFGAINDVGMKSNGSYLLQWKFIEWLKENNFTWYDLNGINPETNPGTYKFKEGLSGKNGKDVVFLGKFDTYKNCMSVFSVRCGEKLLSVMSIRFWKFFSMFHRSDSD